MKKLLVAGLSQQSIQFNLFVGWFGAPRHHSVTAALAPSTNQINQNQGEDTAGSVEAIDLALSSDLAFPFGLTVDLFFYKTQSMSIGNSDALLADKARREFDKARDLVRGYEVTEDFLGLFGKKYLAEALRDSRLTEWVRIRLSRFSDGRGAFLINSLCYRYSVLVPFETLEGGTHGIIDVAAVLRRLASTELEPLKDQACRFLEAWEKMETRRRDIERRAGMSLSKWLQRINVPAHMALSYLSFGTRVERRIFSAAYAGVAVYLQRALEGVWRVGLYDDPDRKIGAPIFGEDMCIDASMRTLLRGNTDSRTRYLAKGLLEHKNKRALQAFWRCEFEDVKERAGAPSWLWDRLWSFKSGADFREAVAMCEHVAADLSPSVVEGAFVPAGGKVVVDIGIARSTVVAAVEKKVLALEESVCGESRARGWQQLEIQNYRQEAGLLRSNAQRLSERAQLRRIMHLVVKEEGKSVKKRKYG